MSNDYKFESIKVETIVSGILSRAYSMAELLTEQSFDADAIYYHVRWYINGARDVMLLDDSVSTNDFDTAQKSLNDFVKSVSDKIGYTSWSDEI